ncbi:MAG: DUF2480 family protein [Saprospiraceae bacterium]|nr:MAG: hypothetical protein UZ09_BCD002001894 [Bacteroidetes bacterium OLB9]MCO6464854.1 DUF2480 family protein [Saprospiraceae bacterium]MCZ2339923.1 DUF2480 family protein [Chitinophagales bacterium]
MDDTILVNRVAQSGIITIDLENYFPKEEFVKFDIKDYLFHGLIVKEKEFRASLKEVDWSQYKDKIVLVNCSTEAIIPNWSYMLIENYLSDYAKDTYHGSEQDYLNMYYKKMIDTLDIKQFDNKRIVIKGCGSKPVPSYAYAAMTSKLKHHAISIMFGEPCSTVPVYKRPKTIQKNEDE